MRARVHVSKLFLAAGFVVLIGAGAAACGSSGASICDLKCECEGCSQSQFNACVAAADSDRHTSDILGCNPQLDDLLACQDATARCSGGGDFQTDCGIERDRWKKCIK